MMKSPRRHGLSLRLAINTVICAAVLGVLFGLLQAFTDYRRVSESLDNNMESILDISVVPAVQVSYNLDSRLAGEMVEGLLQHPAVIEALIEDGEGNPLAFRQRERSKGFTRPFSDWAFGETRVRHADLSIDSLPDISLGRLQILIDTYPAGSQFLQRAGMTLLGALINSLALSALLFMLLHLQLTKPLLRVINATRQVNPEAPEKTRLPVPPGHEYDEIGDLVLATNTHLTLIDSNLAKLREAEDQLREYSAGLEQKVALRTHELMEKNAALIQTNRDLVVAREEAVREARARADFLATMSHEIRTPFNGVLGMIGLALEDPLSEKQKEQLNIAHRSGKALLGLLNDILDISKVESGNLQLESIPFSLRDLLEDTLRLLAPQAHAREISLYSRVDPAFPELVFGDPTRTRQIINNLVGNAIKFTESGHVEVCLDRLNNGLTRLQIFDTGIGIDPDRLEAIFEPFSQANVDTTRRFGGTGLGLTLCRQLISAMRGSIEIDSQPGHGSCFRVLIPLDADEDTSESPLPPELSSFRFHLVFHAGNLTGEHLTRQLDHWSLPCDITWYEQDVEQALETIPFSPNSVLFVDTRHYGQWMERHPGLDELPIILFAQTHIPTDPELFQRIRVKQMLIAPLSRQRLRSALESLVGRDISGKDQAGHETPVQSNNYRVLLVEDNPVNQMVAKAILTRLGYQTIVASNGEEAVEQVLSHPFDIILMDCHMPVMDGFSASRKLRSYPQFNHIPIIALTANVMQGDREKCLDAGMNDYMTKPYERVSLQAMLERWIAQSSPDRPGTSEAS